MTTLATALDYAARGWAVFPCWPRTKAPACQRGFHLATTNPATIRRWWLANSDYNVAIATGIRSSVWILDVDGALGAIALAVLEARHGRLPSTLTSVTGGGCHLWFSTNRPIPSSAGRIATGLDVRGEGGYVLAPPSVHPDGPVYTWRNARSPTPAPSWLVRLTLPPSPPTARLSIVRSPTAHHSGPCGAYGKAALEYEIAALDSTPPGARNHALNRASFCLHQLVAGGELDGADVRNRLIAAATACGLMSDPQDGPRSVTLTIRSGARAGLSHPRTRWGRA